MLYLSIVLVIISCMIVLIKFWNENEGLEKNASLLKTTKESEKTVGKTKKNKKE